VDSPGARPMGVAMAPGGRTAFVTCGRGGQVAEIDVAAAKVARILEKVGARPWGVAITADGRKLYTANGTSNDVSVIDRATGQVVRRIPAGQLPWGVAISPGPSGPPAPSASPHPGRPPLAFVPQGAQARRDGGAPHMAKLHGKVTYQHSARL